MYEYERLIFLCLTGRFHHRVGMLFCECLSYMGLMIACKSFILCKGPGLLSTRPNLLFGSYFCILIDTKLKIIYFHHQLDWV